MGQSDSQDLDYSNKNKVFPSAFSNSINESSKCHSSIINVSDRVDIPDPHQKELLDHNLKSITFKRSSFLKKLKQVFTTKDSKSTEKNTEFKPVSITDFGPPRFPPQDDSIQCLKTDNHTQNSKDKDIAIDVKNLTLKYQESIDPKSLILNNLNFSLKKGEKIAVVGTTGSGKHS